MRSPGRSELFRKLTRGLAALHHLAAIRIKRVIYDPLGGVERVVVLVAEMSEAFGHRLESRPFGLMVERVVGVGTIDDPAKQHEGGIARQLVLLENCLERALLAVVTKLDVLDVVGNGIEPR